MGQRIGSLGCAVRDFIVEKKNLFQMGKFFLKFPVHVKIIEIAVFMQNNNSGRFGPFHHVGQFSFAQIGVDGQGDKAGPFSGDACQEPVNTVGRLNNNAGRFGNAHLYPGVGDGIHQLLGLGPGDAVLGVHQGLLVSIFPGVSIPEIIEEFFGPVTVI